MARSRFDPLKSRVGDGVIGERLLGLSRELGFKVTSATDVTTALEISSAIFPQIFFFYLR
jgi:hypothetical protein